MSTRLQRASALDSLSPSLQELPLSKSLSSISKTTSSANRTRPGPILQLPTPLSENQRSARQRVTQGTSQPGSTPNGPRQRVLRRVRAVVEVPVKEESVDRDDVGWDTPTSDPSTASTSTSAPKPTPASKTPKATSRTTELSNAPPRVKRKASAKRPYVEIDNEESERDSTAHNSRQSDPEYQPVSDDDDELLMGIEVGKTSSVKFLFVLTVHSQTNRKEVYGMKRIPDPILLPKTARPVVVAKKRRVHMAAIKGRPSTSSKP